MDCLLFGERVGRSRSGCDRRTARSVARLAALLGSPYPVQPAC